MTKPSIDIIWAKICKLESTTFYTKSGKPFTYSISESTFVPSRTEYNISKSDFAKVLDLVPLEGPGEVSNLVRGSSYVWAVLHDKKIRDDFW